MNIWTVIMGALIFGLGCYYGRDAYRHLVDKEYLKTLTSSLAAVFFIGMSIDVVTDSQFTWITVATNVLAYTFIGLLALGYVVDCWRDVIKRRWDSAGAGLLVLVGVGLIAFTSTVFSAFVGLFVAFVGMIWRRKYNSEVPEGRFSERVFGLKDIVKNKDQDKAEN